MLDELSYLPCVASDLPEGPWLVVAPHPSDETFGLGGTLSLAAGQGIAVDVVFLTSGGEDVAAIREQEAQAAASVLGVRSVAFWRLPDHGVSADRPAIRRLADAIASAKAASVFFPSPVEPHPDHRAAAVIAWEALRGGGFAAVPWSYEISMQGPANRLLDITPVAIRKREAMAVYASQTARPFAERILGLNQGRAWSLPPGASHAEALFAWPTVDRPLNALLLELQTDRLGTEALPAPAPTVSVIIRTKDRPGLLRQAITSVSAQTYRDIELVVVNDGGEEVGQLVGEYATGSIQRVVCKTLRPGRGRSAAANAGLDLATGEYLIFLDDDDWFLPEHIENLAAKLGDNPNHVAAYSNAACVSWIDGEWRTAFEYKDDFDPLRLAYENYLPIHSVMFRKSALDSHCRFEESLNTYEDWAFWLLLSQKGPFAHIDKPGAMYRTGESSGVGLPGTNRDFANEYKIFIEWAKNHWTDAQALALARGSISLKMLNALYHETEMKLAEEKRLHAETVAALEAAQAALKGQHEEFEQEQRLRESLATELASTKEDMGASLLEREQRLRESLASTKADMGARLERERRLRESLAAELASTKTALRSMEEWLAVIYSSKSWRCTGVLRNSARLLRALTNAEKIKSGLRNFPSKGWDYLVEKLKENYYDNLTITPFTPAIPLSKQTEAVIVCTHHTFYVALLMECELVKLGFSVSIATEEPATYAECLHIVICPQMLTKLPGRYVAFQMEQSVSPRWFTDKYISILENSIAILDYSIKNIAFLQQRGLSYRQIYYLPIGYHPSFKLALERQGLRLRQPREKKYDVLFYGDCHIPRRREILDFLSAKYNLKVISNLFGGELYNEILSAKVVLNIHYYEDALLETTRIYECLSLGVPVVSERSSDQDEHAGLEGLVRFVDCGDLDGMASAIASVLETPAAHVAVPQAVLPSLPSRFGFFFKRFLLAHDIIDFDTFYQHDDTPFVIGGNPVCLGLPETTERRAKFAQKNRHGFSMFDGLRHQQGWIGCAMSYKYLILRAKAEGLPKVLICEDDVEFPSDYEESIATINEYLDGHPGSWNIFSGIISNIHPDTEIHAISNFKGMEFVHINKIVSMVFNIYHDSIYDAIAAWNPSDRNVDSNTVDRFIEHKAGLRIVTTLPYFVGHEEDTHSTLWGFKNTQYIDLITESERLLRKKAEDFKAREKSLDRE